MVEFTIFNRLRIPENHPADDFTAHIHVVHGMIPPDVDFQCPAGQQFGNDQFAIGDVLRLTMGNGLLGDITMAEADERWEINPCPTCPIGRLHKIGAIEETKTPPPPGNTPVPFDTGKMPFRHLIDILPVCSILRIAMECLGAGIPIVCKEIEDQRVCSSLKVIEDTVAAVQQTFCKPDVMITDMIKVDMCRMMQVVFSEMELIKRFACTDQPEPSMVCKLIGILEVTCASCFWEFCPDAP
jgi:hypothetical protein